MVTPWSPATLSMRYSQVQAWHTTDSSVTRSEGSQLNTYEAAATASAKGINTNGGLYFGLKEMERKAGL